MSAAQPPLVKRAACEGLGTALLVAAVIGSGIMGERLAGGNTAIALLANTIATGAALAALITTFGPISGAHFNPVVTLAGVLRRIFPWREAIPYVAAQMIGGLLGAMLAHVMFAQHWYSLSQHARSGWPQLISEFVATFGLLLVIGSCTRHHSVPVTALAVASYITAAYWFTASTSFANPAVTLARSISDTFAGIRPVDVPGFMAAQVAGAAAATLLGAWLESREG
jgi:glycerol uptake facilitator-like aquaporin